MALEGNARYVYPTDKLDMQSAIAGYVLCTV